jgi:hypothetical protein
MSTEFLGTKAFSLVKMVKWQNRKTRKMGWNADDADRADARRKN